MIFGALVLSSFFCSSKSTGWIYPHLAGSSSLQHSLLLATVPERPPFPRLALATVPSLALLSRSGGRKAFGGASQAKASTPPLRLISKIRGSLSCSEMNSANISDVFHSLAGSPIADNVERNAEVWYASRKEGISSCNFSLRWGPKLDEMIRFRV